MGAQIDYDKEKDWKWPEEKQSRWVMPADHYKKTIVFGNVTIDMFMMDTNGWDNADGPGNCGRRTPGIPNPHRCDVGGCGRKTHELADSNFKFIMSEVPKSNATWKFIVGHHPYMSWGGTQSTRDFMIENGVSGYFVGHNHGMEANWHGTNGSHNQHPDYIKGSMFEMVNGAGG